MKKTILMIALIMMVAVSAFAADPAEGYFKSIDDETNEVTALWNLYVAEDGKLYGEIVWLQDKTPSDKAVKCTKVSKYKEFMIEEPWKESLIGTPFLYKLNYVSEGVWQKGHIIRPSDGAHYYSKITYVVEDGVSKLVMKGSIDKAGRIGKKQVWIKVEKEYAEKQIAEMMARM